jgi:hypothetical protein
MNAAAYPFVQASGATATVISSLPDPARESALG